MLALKSAINAVANSIMEITPTPAMCNAMVGFLEFLRFKMVSSPRKNGFVPAILARPLFSPRCVAAGPQRLGPRPWTPWTVTFTPFLDGQQPRQIDDIALFNLASSRSMAGLVPSSGPF
jgi:hypothetical protein